MSGSTCIETTVKRDTTAIRFLAGAIESRDVKNGKTVFVCRKMESPDLEDTWLCKFAPNDEPPLWLFPESAFS